MAKENKIRTGIFGGSFNPIHIGHLALANYLCEYGELDEIWFLVSPHNPLKEQNNTRRFSNISPPVMLFPGIPFL